MPSTYTLNNGIELIGTGEQSGTWGDTTNTNFELLDTALDGQVSVTLAATGSSGSPNTLPISDGASSNGRNRLVIFGDGSDLGGTAYVQLTPNDAEKIIYVRNNLSGSRSILLFQGTYNASNDYEVPAGTTAVVFFNGAGSGAVAANVFNNAFFDSLRLGGVSVTAIIDDDSMGTASATNIATSESIKAYVDAQVGANNELSEVLANGNTTGGTDIAVSTGDDITFADSSKAIFGAGSDLQIYHDGSNSYISDQGTGNLKILGTSMNIQSAAGENYIEAVNNAHVKLFYDAAEKLATTSTGIQVTGNIANASGDLTLDVVGDIILDADGGDIRLSDAGTQFGTISNSGTDLAIESYISDRDMVFKGNDGGSAITALTLDMSAAGAATFNAGVTLTGTLNVDSSTTNGFLSAGSNILNFGTSSNDTVAFYANNTEHMKLKPDGEVIINETGGAEGDLRVESDSNSHMLFVDAGDNSVGIAVSNPSDSANHPDANLMVKGGISFNELTSASEGSLPAITQWSRGGAGQDLVMGARSSSGGLLFYTGNSGSGGDWGDSSNNVRMTINSDGNIIINEDGLNSDFRVESDSNANMLFVDAGADAVCIGTNSPDPNGGVMMVQTLNTHASGPTFQSTGTTQLWLKDSDATSNTRLWGFQNSGGALNFLYADDDKTNNFRTPMTMYRGTTGIVINEDSHDQDFRVESDNNANMLFVDAGSDHVNIGTSSDFGGVLNVNGTIAMNGAGEVAGFFDLSAGITHSGDNVVTFSSGTGGSTQHAAVALWADDHSSYSGQIHLVGNTSNGGTVNAAGEVEFWTFNGSGYTLEGYMGTRGYVFNEAGRNADFRVESDSNANMFIVDAGANSGAGRVTIGGTNQAGVLTVNGGTTTEQTMWVYGEATGKGGRLLSLRDTRAAVGTDGSAGIHLTSSPGTDYVLAKYYDGSVSNFMLTDQLGNEYITVESAANIVINQNSFSNRDFRVESDSNTHKLFVDAGNDQVILNSSVGTGVGGLSNGWLVINQLNDSRNGVVIYNQTENYTAYTTKASNNTGTRYFGYWVNSSGNSVGSISYTSSSSSFNTTSDYRLKENVVNLSGATERLKQLQPKRFNFIIDPDRTVDGFIAHEAATVVPEAVIGEKDAVNDDGSILPQGIDHSKLVPLLVATIKELEARITALENT